MNPAKLCPRFLSCSVNNCPLDSAYPNAFIHPLDSHKSCPMEKNVRIRIASQFPPSILLHSGLTLSEASAKTRYDALPAAVKTQMANRCRDNLKRLRPDKS